MDGFLASRRLACTADCVTISFFELNLLNILTLPSWDWQIVESAVEQVVHQSEKIPVAVSSHSTPANY